ncbi:MAG: bifunctional phosphoglucose/phosphomannose isomerase [Patescibacteria group bacterium]
MASLDDVKQIEKLDLEKMGNDIAALPDQVEAGWQDFKGLTVPTHYVQAKNILILGMGGSAIGGELAAALAGATATVPIEVRRDYGLPGYVGKDTLVIGVSYSGNTEETLDGFRQAATRGAKLLAVSTGGEISSLARKFQIPVLSIDYGSQPRAALGYLFMAVMVILAKLRHVELTEREVTETAALMRGLSSKLVPKVATSDNLAKQLAVKLKDRIPLIIGAGPMATVAKRWKTQFNENGKVAAVAEVMPELCHNVVVGMQKVYRQRDFLLPIFLTSSFAHPRNALRIGIISRQFAASKLPVETIAMQPAGTPLSEALQLIQLGDYISYYMAIQIGADPTEITSIIQLKKELDAQPWK